MRPHCRFGWGPAVVRDSPAPHVHPLRGSLLHACLPRLGLSGRNRGSGRKPLARLRAGDVDAYGRRLPC